MKVLYFRTSVAGRILPLTDAEVKYWTMWDNWSDRVMHERLSSSIVMQVLIQKYEVDFLIVSVDL